MGCGSSNSKVKLDLVKTPEQKIIKVKVTLENGKCLFLQTKSNKSIISIKLQLELMIGTQWQNFRLFQKTQEGEQIEIEDQTILGAIENNNEFYLSIDCTPKEEIEQNIETDDYNLNQENNNSIYKNNDRYNLLQKNQQNKLTQKNNVNNYQYVNSNQKKPVSTKNGFNAINIQKVNSNQMVEKYQLLDLSKNKKSSEINLNEIKHKQLFNRPKSQMDACQQQQQQIMQQILDEQQKQQKQNQEAQSNNNNEGSDLNLEKQQLSQTIQNNSKNQLCIAGQVNKGSKSQIQQLDSNSPNDSLLIDFSEKKQKNNNNKSNEDATKSSSDKQKFNYHNIQNPKQYSDDLEDKSQQNMMLKVDSSLDEDEKNDQISSPLTKIQNGQLVQSIQKNNSNGKQSSLQNIGQIKPYIDRDSSCRKSKILQKISINQSNVSLSQGVLDSFKSNKNNNNRNIEDIIDQQMQKLSRNDSFDLNKQQINNNQLYQQESSRNIQLLQSQNQNSQNLKGIFINFYQGNLIFIEIQDVEELNYHELKQYIAQSENIPFEEQRYIFNGEVLPFNDFKLGYYGIGYGDTLYVDQTFLQLHNYNNLAKQQNQINELYQSNIPLVQ